jgi:hypothetical protein
MRRTEIDAATNVRPWHEPAIEQVLRCASHRRYCGHTATLVERNGRPRWEDEDDDSLNDLVEGWVSGEPEVAADQAC